MDSTAPFQPWAKDGVKNVKSEKELVDDAKLHQENVNHPKHTQTASYDKDSISASSEDPGASSAAEPDAEPSRRENSSMDPGKIASMQQFIENTLSHEGRQRVAQLLEEIEALNGAERLLLYLRLPTGIPPHDPLKQPINPLGSRAELQQTVTWIQTHLEVDPEVSLPKQDVYDEYIAHCMSSNMKPLSTADFGKVMKQVYPSVRPRRLGTRGNSRYCYAGLRKKIKLEVPQLPDLGESSKEPKEVSREPDRTVLDWAESKLGVKLTSMLELSRHVASMGQRAPPAPPSHTPPPLAPTHAPGISEDPSSRQLMKQLKRKIQTQGTPGRPKKNKGVEVTGESPPSSSSYTHARGPLAPHAPHAPVKHESEGDYHYQAYGYEARPPSFPPFGAPPRAHPPPAPHPAPPHEYRSEAYVFEPPYAPRDLSVPDTAHNLPINLSSDASLDLSTERTDWQRRRPPEPPPAPMRIHLPGKKLILETYQSETQAGSLRSSHVDERAPTHPPLPPHAPHLEQFPRSEYLPKKMRAAEILGGKLGSARLAIVAAEAAAVSSSASGTGVVTTVRSEVAFLEDPKNVSSRSTSTAAALAREEQEAASPTQSVKDPTPKCDHKLRAPDNVRMKGTSPVGANSPERPASPDSCCGLDGINIKTGMICEEKHSEILNRERVISICNIDKHALDDYLNEGNSQEHEEELLQYFHHRDNDPQQPVDADACENTATFLEAGQDPQDDHSQGKNEKISQLRELLAKNLKNQNGASSKPLPMNKEAQLPKENANENIDHVTTSAATEGAFKPVLGTGVMVMNGPTLSNQTEISSSKHCTTITNGNGTAASYATPGCPNQMATTVGPNIYNGYSHNVPQSPTTRTQQYDFVPISDGCHSPGNFHTKSPIGFVQRSHSPTKVNKPVMVGGSLQTSPISHSTAASPFVSPRNTPVPRSRLCPRPIPKLNGRKRRNPLSLGVGDPNSKPFAIPNEQKYFHKTSLCGPNIKYCQPMSAPPSPNILSSQYKGHMFQASPGVTNGNNNLHLNFFHNVPFRDNMNGDISQPLSADPLSSEVSQFFQESIASYRGEGEAFRSQSVPLKQALGALPLLSYTHTPVGSVPPTPVPNEFCDFGSLADTCDISKAGLNPETLDKIYDAIDSSNNVLNTGAAQNLLNASNSLSNGCDPLPGEQILTEEQLNSLIPSDGELLDQPTAPFNHSYPDNPATSTDNVDDFLKRAHSIEFDLSDLVTDKSKYYTSRSVPSTPLPFKRAGPSLQIDSQRSREVFAAANYVTSSNGISSKSVPSTPQLGDERGVFSYSNRDFLINGNSVEACGTLRCAHPARALPAGPLHDMLREELLAPLTPAAELLADLDKIDGPPYVDL